MENSEDKIRYDDNYIVALEKENKELRDNKQKLETEIAYAKREEKTGVQLLNE